MRFATRRRLCRATFCTLCLVPTLLVGSAAVIINTPAYQAAKTARWRSHLAARLGLEVKVARIDWNDNARFVVHEIELRDPESHITLARARSAAVVQTDNGPLIKLGQPEVDFQRLPRLVEILHEHLLLRSAAAGASFQLSAPTVVLQKDLRAESVLDARFALEVGDDGTEAFIEFRPTGSAEGDLVRLRVVRNRQLAPPATGWELHTGPVGVPCQLARAWLPQVDYLGNTCTFQGSVWSERLESGWEAEVAGVVRQLDLDRLVTGRFPHKLSGMAELALTRLVVHRGQVAEARGLLCSPGGVVSQTLLKAAEQYLLLKRYAPSSEAMLLRYSDLSLEFSLDEGGLVVAGRDDQDLAVLADSQGPLLSSQDTVQVPPQALVQLLVPFADLQVPAAKETTALLQALPLPAVNPLAPANARRDYAPLQLRRQ